MFGRTLRASIATDNGRSAEFVRKRTYENKQRCFECGDEGHLSYKCPVNVLGEREPPVRKATSTQRRGQSRWDEEETHADNNINADETSFGSVLSSSLVGHDARADHGVIYKRPRIKQCAYLSDDEEVVDESE